METTKVVLTVVAAVTVKEMIAIAIGTETMIVIVVADVKEMIVDAEMTAQIIIAVTVDQNSVLNQGLNKGPLCLIKMQDVDVKNIRITVVIVNQNVEKVWKCAGNLPHIFNIKTVCTINYLLFGTFYKDK